MFEIDRQKFGGFVASLRKEKGLTQKELAEKLYISDKAISKWETGVSIPDVALLVPLSEILDISVTELLKCQRIAHSAPMNTAQVEDIVKTAIRYSEGTGPQRFHKKGLLCYFLCLGICAAEMAAMYFSSTRFSVNENLTVILLLCAVFGLYFMAFSLKNLPAYYDENRISAFSDGPVRLNIPGIRTTNRNWPHIVKVGRLWSMGMLVLYPLLSMLMQTYFSSFWAAYEAPVFLVIISGGLFLPLIVVGRKHP